MTQEEIKQKLIDNNLEKYISVFEENHLFDESVLHTLTNDDFISIGITILGDRKKLQLLFNNTEETSEKNATDEQPKEEYINIVKNGKEFCYLSSEPNKMLCRKCHSRVSEDDTLCAHCNNTLVEQNYSSTPSYYSYSSPIVSSSSDDNIDSEYIPRKESNKGKVITFIIVASIVAFMTYACVSGGSGSSSNKNYTSINSSSSSSSSSKDLSGVSVSLSTTQLELKTSQTLHNVRIRINGDYTYEVSALEPGTYTAGLATFTDSKGNRFNPFSQKVTGVSIFCREGSAYFMP